MASTYLEEGKVEGVRLSTRPDYIDDQAIKLLKKYKVSTVELGAQSMVDEVLTASSRGHSVEDAISAHHAVEPLKPPGPQFTLGAQRMCLPFPSRKTQNVVWIRWPSEWPSAFRSRFFSDACAA